ncbi:hypothetical protein L6164_037355 [Bauhinia variegata]|uniref:Uncharacterized protein n=1 Tax=Bauhinia variegata TaxID=167791 RepID=A0ACB9KJY5_BAUVA|nr:hypothetical protein L6164_037355 [Bauhinia variegata]
MCLCFGGAKLILEGYTNADMAGDLDKRKSTFGYVFIFVRGDISWQSKLQKYVTLSTTEVEYIAVVKEGKEIFWLQSFLQQLGMKLNRFIIHCDSKSALDLSKNATYNSQTKHIGISYHWLREALEQK